jgi:hypothetical protein
VWLREALSRSFLSTRCTVPTEQPVSAAIVFNDELLLSPAVKRRAGIELKRVVDVDGDAAVSMVGKYKQVLKSV